MMISAARMTYFAFAEKARKKLRGLERRIMYKVLDYLNFVMKWACNGLKPNK